MTGSWKNSMGKVADRVGSAAKKAIDAAADCAPTALMGAQAGAAGVGVVGGGLAALEGTAISAIGFTPLGPAAGSFAASWMSSIAAANGVGVSAGSWYAAMQASAMGGAAVLGAPFVIGTCVAGAVAGAAVMAAVHLKRKGGGGDAARGDDPATEDSFVAEGPWGGLGGCEFTGCTGDITEIVVFHNDSQVVALDVQYQSSGSIFEGRKYGGDEENFTKIILEPENEYITRLTGTYGLVNDIQVITALTFVSNKAVYGPFGTEVGSSFSSSGLGKVVGFFGRSGSFIDQLGVISKLRAGKGGGDAAGGDDPATEESTEPELSLEEEHKTEPE